MDERRAMVRREVSLALFTAFYELTMAQGYWQNGRTASATFSLFVRRYPPDRGYFVFAGLSDILDYLEAFRFSSEDIAYLASLNVFDRDFLSYLSGLRFTGTVRAMPEGTVFFATEPVLEVIAPIIEGQILENFILNQFNLQTMLASKAARVTYAARGRAVTEFGSRRTPGIDASDKLVRLGYMAGFSGSGNVYAAARHGVAPAGTMAHSFVTSFPREVEAFQAYARSFPNSSIFLVDTYDTIRGTKNAIRVAREMRRHGHDLRAVRLDSGNLLELSRKVRTLLDEEGFPNVRIVASGDLDEFQIADLLAAGAPIDSFGVGTRVGTSSDAPWTDCVYKLVEYDGAPVLKLSPGKETLPGGKQVYRFRDEKGRYLRDLIGLLEEEAPAQGGPLLEEVMRYGKRVAPAPGLDDLRAHLARELACLPERHEAIRSPAPYRVTLSPGLRRLHRRLARRITAEASDN